MHPENSIRQWIISGYKHRYTKQSTKKPKTNCAFGYVSARAQEAKQKSAFTYATTRGAGWNVSETACHYLLKEWDITHVPNHHHCS